MTALVHVHVDDFPDFVLAGFGDHRRAWGRYPRVLVVSPLLGELMGARPGLWTPVPGCGGVWGWVRNLVADRMDEFGRPH